MKTSVSFASILLPDHCIRSLTNYLRIAVWQEISTAVGAVISTWWEQPEPILKALQAFRRELFKPLARRLGLDYNDTDDVDAIELRTLAYTALANSDDAETLAAYRKRFDTFVETGDEAGIPSDLKTSIYSASVRHGGEKEYEKVLAVYRQPPTPAHKDSAIAGLCASRDPSLIERTLKMIMSDEVRSQVRFTATRHFCYAGILSKLDFSTDADASSYRWVLYRRTCFLLWAISLGTPIRRAKCGSGCRRTLLRSRSVSRAGEF
jgi:hypothetical protein